MAVLAMPPITVITYDKLTFGKGTKLVVKPETQKQVPSVYKLESSNFVENLPNSVCLITDIPNTNKNITVDGKEVHLDAMAVLDNSTNNVWRYSTVIWDVYNNTDVTCNWDNNTESDTDNTEETCSSLVTIQTNPSLNKLSLTVLGLRILTAKAIVFNLIITARLWSY